MSLRFGAFTVSVHNHGYFRLDGGAMFGTVPRTIWSKLTAPDGDNRIRLAARSLIIRTGSRVFMVDAGLGDRWTDKLRQIYGIEPRPVGDDGFEPEGVTDIVLTHLHFDHAAGIFCAWPGREGQARLKYPRARVHLQAANLENARNPNVREKASYRGEELRVLEEVPWVFASGSAEIYPGISVHRGDGHTRGHQWVQVCDGDTTLAFPSDVVPTSRHLPLPYLMGYDIWAEKLLEEKDELLSRAVAGRWILVFGHDPDVPAARIGRDERGHYALDEVVSL